MTQVFAHRGASKRARENTLDAFVLARAMNADGVEQDVRRTQDGLLALHHDPHLSDGRVLCDTAAGDLPSYVPDLASALDVCLGMVVNIEIKNEPGEPDFDASESVAAAVVALLLHRNGADDVLISSFHLPTIDHVRLLNPSVPTAWLVDVVGADTVDVLLAHGHRVLHPWVKKVTPALIAMCHERGVAVNTWTCDNPVRMAELLAWGIDGICTNVPDVAVAARSARQHES